MTTKTVVNEGSAAWLSVAFTDKTGAPATPATLSYRVDCLTTGTEVLADTDIEELDEVVEIMIGSTLNAWVGESIGGYQIRRVTITSQYGDEDALVTSYDYLLRSMSHYPSPTP